LQEINTEMGEIINHATGIAIINGGPPLPGCPADWNEADRLLLELNKGKDEDGYEPQWSWDCGFKLDYDGGLLRIGSRFYPPTTGYGPTWDGSVTVYFMDEALEKKEFDCNTLEELKAAVESHVQTLIKKYREKIFQ
jgi:hypothetical protein